MKNRILGVMTVIGMAVTLSGCLRFPTEEDNYSTNKRKEIKEADRVSIETARKNTAHIKEDGYDKFSIDADVEIQLSDNFSIYKAVPAELKFEAWAESLAGDRRIKESYSDESGGPTNIYEDGTAILKWNDMIKQQYYEYYTQEIFDRDMEWLYLGKNDFNGRINFERDTIWKRKELDFMGSDEACRLVREKMEAAGINGNTYQVYAVDYDYITERNEKDREIYSDEDTPFEYIDYTKDDEFYIVIPEIRLPDGGLLTEMFYFYTGAEDDFSTVYSATNYAVVGKNGILEMFLYGNYDILSQDSGIQEIVSVESACQVVTDSYIEVVLLEPQTASDIKLSYVPYVVDDEEGIYEIRPTWVFYITKTTDDGSLNRCVKLVDAVTGKLVVQGNDGAF